MVERQYADGWWDWLNAFTLLCGFALVTGYALQGACWLILRTEGELRHSARRHARALGLATLALIVVISLWTPILNDVYWKHWFSFPRVLLTAPVPILVTSMAWAFWRALRRHHDMMPFLCAQAWFLLCYAGLGISIWPMIVPPSISNWDAAAPSASHLFLLVGAAILIPLILGYTSFSYWTFPRKVGAQENYQ